MGAGRAGPAARAWFLVCVSGGSCVCRLLGPAGVPCTEHRVTGNPASTPWLSPTPSVQAAYPWTGRGCVRRRATPLSCRSRACLGSAGAGAGAPLSGRAGCCASGSQSCFPDGCPAGSLCTQECGERGPATPPPCFRPVWRTVGPLLTSCHCNPLLSTPPFSSGVSTPQRQSRRPPGVHVKPSLAAVSGCRLEKWPRRPRGGHSQSRPLAPRGARPWRPRQGRAGVSSPRPWPLVDVGIRSSRSGAFSPGVGVLEGGPRYLVAGCRGDSSLRFD